VLATLRNRCHTHEGLIPVNRLLHHKRGPATQRGQVEGGRTLRPSSASAFGSPGIGELVIGSAPD